MADPERYVTVQELRDEGLPGDVSTPVTDAQALILLQRSSDLVEKITNNIFYIVQGTYIFDGNNAYLLHLPIAIIEITSLKINNESGELATNEYRVYNGTVPPQDDRGNPKIELRNSAAPSIYSGLRIRKFLKGLDQTITGRFGYVEEDETTPAIIKECVSAIVMMTWRDLFTRFGYESGGGGGPMILGPKKREITDDHEVEWWQSNTGFTEQGLVVPPYVNGRLKMFKGPHPIYITKHRFEVFTSNTNE
jgi:hypothetical protein